MRRIRRIAALALCAALLAAIALLMLTRWPATAATAAMGRVHVYPAWLLQRGFALVFSAAPGWSGEDAAAALTLARQGYRVIGVDTPALLARAAQQSGCLYLPGVLEGYSEAEQRRAGGGRYREPILAGRGAGGTLVYLALVQAPVLAFSGGVVLDAVPELAFDGAFCGQTAAARPSGRYAVSVRATAAGIPAVYLDSGAGDAASAGFMKAMAARGGGLTDLSREPAASLGARYAAACRTLAARQVPKPLADLPLVELPVTDGGDGSSGGGGAFAILYSGDGGWRDLDRSLAAVLVGRGLPVVGVDLLHYYWKPRSPEDAARDLARIESYYQRSWGRQQVILIGFSLGANVLPFLVNRLPPGPRAALRLVTLLSPERATAFQIDPRNWLGLSTHAGLTPVGPELQRLPRTLVQCVYGAAEAARSLCTTPAAQGVRVLRKIGDHHFDYDYGRLADDILQAAKAGR